MMLRAYQDRFAWEHEILARTLGAEFETTRKPSIRRDPAPAPETKPGEIRETYN